MSASPPASLAPRWPLLDALRALAMLWMAAFHFAFDLNHFGLLMPRQNFYGDALWTVQRSCIVSLFLFCAGFGQALAPPGGPWGPGSARFWHRWAQIAGCALLVSLGSWWMFPRSWIAFGVLHGMAAMLILLRLAAPLRGWLWPVALACLLLPSFAAHPAFDAPLLQWLGLMTRKPVTEDYVPVLPWLGVMLIGLLAGQRLRSSPLSATLAAPLPRLLAPLASLGRWPLSFYMLHQPLLIGAILLFLKLR